MQKIFITTITPVYNGAKYLEKLVEKLEIVRNNWLDKNVGLELIESIFVIDECVDNSHEVLQKLQINRNWIRVIQLSRNFGQHPATIAGILHSAGDWVFTLDEDGQHDPASMIKFLKKVAIDKTDICYAKSLSSTHDSFIRDKVSVFFKYLISAISGNPNIESFNSFRLLRGDIARAAAATCRNDTYFDIALCWYTNRIQTVEVVMEDERNQNNEKSGYSFWGLIRHARRLLLSTKIRVLRIGLAIGVLSFLISFILGLIFLISYFSDFSFSFIRGWLSLSTMILFFGGVTSLIVSIILDAVFGLIENTTGKPTFFVVDRSGDETLSKILTEGNF